MSSKTKSLASLTIADSRDVSGDISGWIFFCIFCYARLTISFVGLLLISKFKIL